MSWHIHYTTVTEDMPRFYEAFLSRFADRFNPVQYPGFLKHQCPFGPNFGSSTFECAQRTPLHGANTMPQRPSPAFRPADICSLEGPMQEHSVRITEGGDPWPDPQRAFFIPIRYADEAWQWALANKGEVRAYPTRRSMNPRFPVSEYRLDPPGFSLTF
jgi:hypothetical protein